MERFIVSNEMESMIQFLLVLHIISGSTSLVSGLISMLVKKGRKTHKRAGLVFVYSMLICGLSAIVIAVLPQHTNPFLFSVGLFSLYFIITGQRALLYKKTMSGLFYDKMISIFMIVLGSFMMFWPVITTGTLNVVLLVFGVVGILFAARDLSLFYQSNKLTSGWLKLHLSKMISGYISAFTAFVVVNNVFPSLYGWFIPGIIGGMYIAYWMGRIDKSKFKAPE